ncbi:inositol-3-phosphate synthase [Aquimarina sp. ERC-38]|uniref:inositol-3-phosphate synthase n=1 Tax=Aquimarina sp. ERC-38 TaxID=2949996 RepID=UPI0022477846|nr:inositol-3-phosphate synthase [Aquimarina sp. ERC-38]UZO79259.1 inositol-3-phosphate synthase [Aquimarina sp. ERC-38]
MKKKEQTAPQKMGVAIIGLGGAVATTAIAGSLLLKKGIHSKAGLPLAEFDHFDLAEYENIVFRGWDLYDLNLHEAACHHGVLSKEQLKEVESELSGIKPWPAISNKEFCEGVALEDEDTSRSLSKQVECIIEDIQSFEAELGAPVVIINLASTEHAIDMENPAFQTLKSFETALEEDSKEISPAMLYAYAAIKNGNPYANFTPSVAVDIPALIEFAETKNVPVGGKDGKTGQTYIKTVIAPSLRARALKVDGWFSTNILGNRDGKALDKPKSLQSKLNTKGTVLDSCLNYPVENHVVHIHYYKPRGDNKEAWDNIDVSGFLDHKMQIKVNFLCKDSILAAPLVIEIARCLELAQRKEEGGILKELGVFFKSPLTPEGEEIEHRFDIQQQELLTWLEYLQTRESISVDQKKEEDVTNEVLV